MVIVFFERVKTGKYCESVTVTAQVAESLPALAVITALPAPTAVTVPLFTVATAGASVSQVIFSVEPVRVGVNVNVSFFSRV